MKELFRLSFLVGILVLGLGCASGEKSPPRENAIWKFDTKAQVTDKVKSESQTVSIELFSLEQKLYRFEVTGAMGIQAASLLMKRNAGAEGLTFVLYPQKAYGVGTLDSQSLRPLFNQNLDPNILIDLIEDRQLRKYDLLCGRQSETAVKCTNDDMEVVIEKPASSADQFVKRITIDSEKYRLVWVFKSQDYMNDYDNEMLAKTFVLEPPEGYRRLKTK